MQRLDSMRHATSLIHALEGIGAETPEVLRNIVDGFEIIGQTDIPPDPAKQIMASAVAGKLTAKALDQLLTKAAAEAAVSTYRQDLSRRADKMFAAQFHTALKDGAADEVLDNIRPHFEATATELNKATSLVDLQNTPQRLLTVTASAEEQSAWAALPDLVRRIDRITAIAVAFGPHGSMQVVDDRTNRDTLLNLNWLDDRTLMCTTGNPTTASNAFRAANPNWSTSPWLKVSLKLATIAEAQETIRELAEQDFEARMSQRSGSGTLTENGFVPDAYVNPHKAKVAA